MPAGDVQTFYADNQWHNRIEGTSFVFGTSATRGEAVWAGRGRARCDATAHVVCGVDGRIEQRHNYSERPSGRSASQRLSEQRSIILGGF